MLAISRDISGKECSYVDDLPDKNCRFVPDEKQVAVSSLMSFYYIANVRPLDQRVLVSTEGRAFED